VARQPGGQIPLDDEPIEIDLGDLPSEDEFRAAEEAEAMGGAAAPFRPGASGGPAIAAAPPPDSILGLFQLWVTLVAVLYVIVGCGVGFLFAFRGAAEAGWAAFRDPGFYLVILFWPIALWQLAFNQF
jgi:hypothetical protein